jgi:hypothetical protein
LKLLRLVNERRREAGFEPVPVSALNFRRKIVKVFSGSDTDAVNAAA